MTETKNEWVELAYDFTVNLGNFENVRIHVGRGTVIKHGETEDEAYARLDKFVSEKVSKEVVEARQGAK